MMIIGYFIRNFPDIRNYSFIDYTYEAGKAENPNAHNNEAKRRYPVKKICTRGFISM